MRNDPPSHIREQELTNEEKREDLAIQRNYTMKPGPNDEFLSTLMCPYGHEDLLMSYVPSR